MYRKQWAGMGRCTGDVFRYYSRSAQEEKTGIGYALLQQDKIGVTKQTDVYGMLAYHLPLGVGKLSVGLQAGVSNFSSEVVKLTCGIRVIRSLIIIPSTYLF